MTTGKNTGEQPPTTPAEPTFGMKRAAEVAGVSVSTIRRNKELLRQHGALLHPDGWQVPMSALIASGLMRRTTPPDVPAMGAQKAGGAFPEEEVRERVRELEHALELERERRRSAEALAHERGEALEAERMALRMLTAGMATTTTTANVSESSAEAVAQKPEAPPEPKKRTFWNRLWG